MMKATELLGMDPHHVHKYHTTLARLESLQAEMSLLSESDIETRYRPYLINAAEGIVTIPVSGMLINRGDTMLAGLYTSYEYIANTWLRAMQDDSVEAVILDIDSYGGTVLGLFENYEHMLASKTKPVLSVVPSAAASAAYLVSLLGDEIVAQESATVGSIGALLVHTSYAKQLEMEGVDVTVFRSAPQKAETMALEKLSEEAKGRLQNMVNLLGERFEKLTAERRGVALETVKGTEAAGLSSQEALELGLIDKIGLVKSEIMSYTNNINKKRETIMSESTANQPQATASPAASAAAPAQPSQSEIAQTVKNRISAVLNSPEAQGHENLAKSLAFETDLSAEAAIQILKDAHKDAAAVPAAKSSDANDFEKIMLASGNPEVGAGANDESIDPIAQLSNILFTKKERR